MPTSRKSKPRNSDSRSSKPLKDGQVLFVLDAKGKPQDATLQNEILNGGDHVEAQAISMAVMRKARLTTREIHNLMPVVIDRDRIAAIRAKRGRAKKK